MTPEQAAYYQQIQQQQLYYQQMQSLPPQIPVAMPPMTQVQFKQQFKNNRNSDQPQYGYAHAPLDFKNALCGATQTFTTNTNNSSVPYQTRNSTFRPPYNSRPVRNEPYRHVPYIKKESSKVNALRLERLNRTGEPINQNVKVLSGPRPMIRKLSESDNKPSFGVERNTT